MRALIIGGAGAIGAAVARHCCAVGIETHAGLRVSTNPDRLAGSLAVRRHLFELTEPESAAALIEAVQPDWIVMAALPSGGHADDAQSRRNLLLGMSRGLLGLMEAIRLTGFAGPLTWIGSAMSYGRGENIRRSSDALRPVTFRGAVKAAESVLAGQMASEFGLMLTELRVFTGYGPFEQRGRLISTLLRAGLLDEHVPLTALPAHRDWIHYDDIASACVASAAPAGPEPRMFNICSGQLHDTHAIARMLEQITGKRLVGERRYESPDRYGEVLPGELPSIACGLAWSPRIDLREGLEWCWRWACSPEGRAYLLQERRVAA